MTSTSRRRLQQRIRLLIIFAIALDTLPLSSTTTILGLSNTTESISDVSDNKSSDVISKKPGKKKAYAVVAALTEIPIGKSQIDDDQNLFESLQGHPAGFDFNLDDFEDVHESFKKGNSNSGEETLLRDSSSVDLMPMTIAPIPVVTLATTTMTNESSPNIYRVSKGSKQKVKNNNFSRKDEAHKHLGLRLNSFDFSAYGPKNASEIVVGDSMNFFPIMLSLYNQYRWHHAEIRTKVSAGCGVELYAYLSALNNNAEWAQKAYDSSGRYRGQFLYGNDLWLGEKIFCYEINHRANQSEREQFPFGFFIARISIKNLPENDELKILNLGQCLPQSCSPKDVQSILELDSGVRLLQELTLPLKIQVETLDVRRVPGEYSLWSDKGFYVMSSLFIIIFATAIASTLYAIRLNTNCSQQDKEKPGNSQKLDPENGKTFELFQIQTVEKSTSNSNNNNNACVEVDRNSQIPNKNIEKVDFKSNNLERKQNKRKRLGIGQQIFLCFDMGSNASTIFSVISNKEKVLSSVHGIKVLSLLWTMLVHNYIFIFNVGENRYRRTIYERSFAFQLVGNATFSVDTFFYISGVLVTYLFYKHEKQSGKTTNGFVRKGLRETMFLMFYRYVRLTPTYLFVIFLNRISLQYVLNESVFTPHPIDYPSCSKYWWRNILYINNWYPFKEFCMHWSWYLANDMQFYLMAILLLIFSRRYFKFSVTTILIFLCTSWVTSGIVSLHFNYTFKLAKPFLSFDILYDKPWQRIGSYIVGMITGYVIYSVKTPPRVPFMVNVSLWLCTIGIFFALIFGVWTGELGLLSTAFYVGIGHTAWAVGLVWITLSCVWGLFPSLNAILSYRGFLPLSRLTYCTYLVHPVIISITTFSLGGPINLQHPMLLTLYMGNAVLSLLAAFVISLLFEAPVIKIQKIVMHK